MKMTKSCEKKGDTDKVYNFFQINPFESIIKVTIPGKEKIADLSRIKFLNPFEVDPASMISSTPMKKGYAVDEASVPKSLCWESKNKPLPDVIMHQGVEIVSEKVKNIIECFEDNIHQFIPVDINRIRESNFIAKYYWLVVCRRINCADPSKTTFKRHPRGLWLTAGEGKIVIDSASIGRAHLWHDPNIVSSIFCSGKLAMSLEKAMPSGLLMAPMETV